MTALRSAICAFALVTSWFAALVAHANNATASDLVLIGGNAAARDLATVATATEAAVRSAGWSLPQQPLPRAESERLLKCFDVEDPTKCVKGPSIARVFMVTANKTNESGVPVLVLIGKVFAIDQESPDENRFVTRQRHCENCSDDALSQESTTLVTDTLKELSARVRKTFVSFTSDPPGAQITLDGKWIGLTNGTFSVAPGKHRVRFAKEGYIAEDREFSLDERRTIPVSATLKPSRVERPQSAPSKIPPISLIAGGVAVMTTGIVWSLYPTKNVNDDPYRYPRALSVGIPVAIVGAGVTTFGVVWLLKRRSSAPTAAVTSRGAVVGWMGTF